MKRSTANGATGTRLWGETHQGLRSRSLSRLFAVYLSTIPALLLQSLAAAEQTAPENLQPVVSEPWQAEIQYSPDSQRLSAHLEAMPFARVVDRLGEVSGTKFVISADDYGPVSAEFEDLPLQEGIKKLLFGVNYMIVGSVDGISVFVLSRGDNANPRGDEATDAADGHATPARVGAAPPAAAVAGTPSAPDDFQRYVVDSIGDAEELADLRMQLTYSQNSWKLDEADRALLDDPTNSGVADILLDKLLSSDTPHSLGKSVMAGETGAMDQ